MPSVTPTKVPFTALIPVELATTVRATAARRQRLQDAFAEALAKYVETHRSDLVALSATDDVIATA